MIKAICVFRPPVRPPVRPRVRVLCLDQTVKYILLFILYGYIDMYTCVDLLIKMSLRLILVCQPIIEKAEEVVEEISEDFPEVRSYRVDY